VVVARAEAARVVVGPVVLGAKAGWAEAVRVGRSEVVGSAIPGDFCFVNLDKDGPNPTSPPSFQGGFGLSYSVSQHLQYLDSNKSSTKDLSLPLLEIRTSPKTFSGRRS
jgi:hypothetical protein